MNGVDGFMLWKNLKQRLSFKSLGCCGSTWTPRATIRTIIEEVVVVAAEEEEEGGDSLTWMETIEIYNGG